MSITKDSESFIQKLKSGDHISCIYKTEENLYSLVIPYFVTGLQLHNKCVYVYEDATPESIIGVFKDSGFDIRLYIEKADFIFLTKNDVYLNNGIFNADSVISIIQDLSATVKSQGYTALRFAGDASWLRDHDDVATDFMKYEARVNSVIQDSGAIALCLYKESFFNERILIDVLRTHPVVYLYDRFVSSKYFAPSDDFMPMGRSESTADRYQKIITSLLNAQYQD